MIDDKNMRVFQDIVMITYPRSGLNLFRTLLGHHGLSVRSSHFIGDANDSRVTTIFRNPKDSIASHYAMLKKYRPHSEISTTIDALIVEYISSYLFFYSRAELLINYEELVINPSPSMDAFFNKFEIEHNSVESYDLSLVKDDPGVQHLKTSTGMPGHLESYEYLERHPMLTEAVDAFDAIVKRYSAEQ